MIFRACRNLGSKGLPLLRQKYLFFTSYSTREEIKLIDKQMLFTDRKDMYNCVTVKSDELRDLPSEDFVSSLEASLQNWKCQHVRGVWFKVSIKDTSLIAHLVANSFVFHHAQPEYVMLTRWLAETPNSLPNYAHTFIGCGGIVEDAGGRVLMMREKNGIYLGWKFPGGLADPGESVMEAAEREVEEETGIQAETLAVISFRQIGAAKWRNTGDIYFLCAMKPRDPEKIDIVRCENEAADARWFTRKEINELPEDVFHSSLRDSLSKYDEWRSDGEKAIYPETVFSPFKNMPMHLFYGGTRKLPSHV